MSNLEEELAIEIFKKEEHLDPRGQCELDSDDWGFSKLDEQTKQFYLSLANHLQSWIYNNYPSKNTEVKCPRCGCEH